MKELRYFAVAKGYEHLGLILPQRATAKSAGYDLASAEDIIIRPWETVLIPTGVKAYMGDQEALKVYFRSSTPRKKCLFQPNGVGVVDADYVDNPDNDGLIYVQVLNFSDRPVLIERYERIAQGIFEPFLITDDDNATGIRTGGVGSTGSFQTPEVDLSELVQPKDPYKTTQVDINSMANGTNMDDIVKSVECKIVANSNFLEGRHN